jgi:hypothetical protein
MLRTCQSCVVWEILQACRHSISHVMSNTVEFEFLKTVRIRSWPIVFSSAILKVAAAYLGEISLYTYQGTQVPYSNTLLQT